MAFRTPSGSTRRADSERRQGVQERHSTPQIASRRTTQISYVDAGPLLSCALFCRLAAWSEHPSAGTRRTAFGHKVPMKVSSYQATDRSAPSAAPTASTLEVEMAVLRSFPRSPPIGGRRRRFIGPMSDPKKTSATRLCSGALG